MSMFYLVGLLMMLGCGVRWGMSLGRAQAPEYWRGLFEEATTDAAEIGKEQLEEIGQLKKRNAHQGKLVMLAMLAVKSDEPKAKEDFMDLFQGLSFPSGVTDEVRREYDEWRAGKLYMPIDKALTQLVRYVEATQESPGQPNAVTRLAAKALGDFVLTREDDEDDAVSE